MPGCIRKGAGIIVPLERMVLALADGRPRERFAEPGSKKRRYTALRWCPRPWA